MEEIKVLPRDENLLSDVSHSDDHGHSIFQNPDEKIKTTTNFLLQISLLLKKNFLIQKRSLKTLALQLLMPVIICGIIYILQICANSVVGQSVEDPPITSFEKVPQCFYRADDPENCTTIAYAVIGNSEPWMHSVIQYVAKDNNLTRENDVKFIGEVQPAAFQQYLKNNTNQTQLGVIFCNSEWQITSDIVIPCTFARNTSKKLVFYSIVYNVTELFASMYTTNFQGVQPIDPVATSLKMSLDSAIFSYFFLDKSGKGDQPLVLDPEDPNMPKIRNVNKQEYPRSFLRFFIGIDIVTATGALQFFVPYMINFIITIIEIIREKEKRLRQGLSVMGMSHVAYWISWFITSLIINLLVTIITVGMGFCFGYQFFTQTPFLVTFLLFFLLGQALQALAFWITTICGTSNAGYTLAFSILLVSVVLQAFLTTSYISFMFFLENPPIWFIPIRLLFQLFPSYNFSVVFGRITLLSGRHYDLDDNYWKQGTGFSYDDLFKNVQALIFGLEYNVPEVIIFYLILVLNIIFYLTLAWYCDNVIAHNRGTGKSFIFCLKRKLKKVSALITDQEVLEAQKNQILKSQRDSTNVDGYDSDITGSVKNERNKVLQQQLQNPDSDGLRILDLTKIYVKSSRNSSKNVHALRSLFMSVEKGELLGLLGPNGAGFILVVKTFNYQGKTTLIGLLTGLLTPTIGTAIINGLDIKHQIDKIREVIGVCPQFDILWDELTAEEHLYMFAKLKKIPEENVEDEIEQRLREVNLYDVKQVQTRAFSGGMKRRLSIAIALIGNPKTIFLDEPTTGMDPKNRQYIWQLIQKMKKGRAVILTTHAMEEADVLSDRIAIIMGGKLKCIGTPLFLKSEYGDGYRLSLIIDKEDVDGTIFYIKNKIPSGRIIDSSGGSVLVGIPLSKKNEMQEFLKVVEEKNDSLEKKEFLKRIKDWGLRHSTLEEVFMKVNIINNI